MGPPPANCPARCQDKASACQAPPSVSGPVCSQICSGGLTEEQLSCLESSSCAALEVLINGGSTCGIGGGGVSDGGGTQKDIGKGGSCAIPKKSLKASVPYFYDSSTYPTLVEVAGSCVGEEGYSSASVLHALRDETFSVKIVSIAGVMYQINYALKQHEVPSSKLSTITSKTGIPKAAMEKGRKMVVSVTGSTKAIDPLPSGVTADVFLPSSTSQKGFVRFSSKSKAALETTLSQLSKGIRLETRLKPFSGMGGQYTVQLEMKSSFTKMKVLGIQRL